MGPEGKQRKLSWSLNSSHYVIQMNIYIILCTYVIYHGINRINIFAFFWSAYGLYTNNRRKPVSTYVKTL